MIITGKFLNDPDCIKQMKFVNAPAWQKAGYLGDGLTVFLDDITDQGHVATSKDIILAYLPKSTVLSGKINYITKSGAFISSSISCTETKETLPFDDFIRKHNVKLINNSTDGGKGTKILPDAAFMKEKIKQHNLIVCGAAGNGNGQPTTQKYYGACIVVTQCTLKNGQPVFSNKACGTNIDFSMFAGPANGTSHASPSLLALIGYLCCRDHDVTQEEVYQYLKDHCLDLGATGKDDKFGWGVPIMGNPKKTIVLQVGSNVMTVDGVDKLVEQPPEIDPDTDRTVMPLRAVIEELGGTVDWDPDTKKITIER